MVMTIFALKVFHPCVMNFINTIVVNEVNKDFTWNDVEFALHNEPMFVTLFKEPRGLPDNLETPMFYFRFASDEDMLAFILRWS